MQRKWQVGVIVALIIAFVIFCLVFWLNNSRSSTPAITAKFSFTEATGWHLGFSNQKPEVSQVIFSDNNNCFISTEYHDGQVDAYSEIQKTAITLGSRGYIITDLQTSDLSMDVNGKATEYSVHQQSVGTPTNNEPIEGGQEFGFIQLDSGYIKVAAYCDTPDQLASTLDLLKHNISFHL